MTKKVPQHAHCNVCGEVVPAGDEVCGSECREQVEARRRKQKRWMYLFYAAMAVAVGGLLARILF